MDRQHCAPTLVGYGAHGPLGTATQKSVGHCDCVPVSPDFGTHGPAGLDANPGSVGHMSLGAVSLVCCGAQDRRHAQ